MSGFDDLVPLALPALYGGGVTASATEGKTWSWTWVDVNDDAGTPINMSTGITGTCKIYEGSAVILTLTYTGGTGTFTVSATKDQTADLAGAKSKRLCRWGLEIDNGTKAIQVWEPPDSAFTIISKDGVA